METTKDQRVRLLSFCTNSSAENPTESHTATPIIEEPTNPMILMKIAPP